MMRRLNMARGSGHTLAETRFGRRCGSGRRGPGRGRAFTLLEVMIAMMIFAMVLTAIYSVWIAILRGTRAGVKAAAEVQRSRIAMRSLEDAFLSAVMFPESSKHYYDFIADSSRDMAGVSMVSRLPASFPGVGRYGDQIVRRVTFTTRPGKEGQELVMVQAPMLLDTNNASVTPYSLVLARDVTLFNLDFWDVRQNDWVSEWINTNQLPSLVRITLGLGKVGGNASKPQDLVSRVVALPSISVAGVQGGRMAPGMPGGMPPVYNPNQPPGYPPGVPPGVPPGGYRPGMNPGNTPYIAPPY